MSMLHNFRMMWPVLWIELLSVPSIQLWHPIDGQSTSWRHDSVLRIMKRNFSLSGSPHSHKMLSANVRASLSSQPYIRFVPAGLVPRTPDRCQTHSSNLHDRHPMSSSKSIAPQRQWLGVSFWFGRLSACFLPRDCGHHSTPIVILSR